MVIKVFLFFLSAFAFHAHAACVQPIEVVLSDSMTKRELHSTLAQAFQFPDYYGNNLDALYDVLSETDMSCAKITCVRESQVESVYFEDLAALLEELSLQQPGFELNCQAEHLR